MIDKYYEDLSISGQCELLEVSRSTFYYTPKPASESELDLMTKIDELHLNRPYLGSRGIRRFLKRQGIIVNRKRIQRLMKKMGISSVYRKIKTSKPNPEHKIYPYLLKGLQINRPNQVWCTDITYIPMKRGFVYLIAIMDLYSRHILSWKVSNTLDTRFCIEALEEALSQYGKPEIFNSDQGSQFTSLAFTEALKEQGIKISMDGKGRVIDNIFIERFWKSLKYEEVYLKSYETVKEAVFNIGEYIWDYNNQRPHSSLDDRTPAEAYFNTNILNTDFMVI